MVYLMDRDQLQREVAETLRRAEIKAVARVLRSGTRPSLGQFIDYTIEHPPFTPSKRAKPYRVSVEQWHLDAAERLLQEAGA